MRKFRGAYSGAWTTAGTKAPLQVRIGTRIRGTTAGRFEATPCNPDDGGLAPLKVRVTRYRLSGSGRKLTLRGRVTWQRSRNPQIGGPNMTGPLRLVASGRGNRKSLTGRMTAGLKRGPVRAKKRGQMPTVPEPWIEMVWVGYPGNANDPEDADPSAAGIQNLGAEARDFKIGKYEVTNAQYAGFLNAVARTDPNGLYATEMGTDPRGGIVRTNAPGNYTYTAGFPMADKPVNFVSVWNAFRFCNWLHNGRPDGDQGPMTTEEGAYDLSGDAISNNTVTRNAGARYFLPSYNEWYKAAYHDPRTEAQSGPPGDDRYWQYPTSSDDFPTRATADSVGNIDNDTANIANFERFADWAAQDGNVTTVGSGGPGSACFYGAFDMAGNVFEWTETPSGGGRVFRGGSWRFNVTYLRANSPPTPSSGASEHYGFRVAAPAN